MKFSFTLLLLLSMQLVFGQSMTYESRILDVSGIPIPGATVTELGTSNVAISDQDGRFRISSSKQNLTLRISFIGFETQDVVINDGVLKKEIKLLESTESLEEFVVTALGVERQRQSLSSAVTTIGARELSDVPQTNLINSLSGQVAGVQITNGSSGVGSSSRIIIRGENSISGNNQALIVIDGVPIINEQITSDLFNDGANIQEVDFGNGAAEINPDDIESITILKGPGSAALYGARAANGVVLITTKKGRKKQGIGVTTSSLLTFDGLLTLPDYQNEYGGGSNGQYSFQNGIGAGVNDGGISSYGPRLNQGLLIAQFDSPSVDINGNPVRAGDVISRRRPDGTFTAITPTPWIARPDNVRDFFRTGVTSQNNIAVTSGNEKGGARIAYSNLRNEGILPNTDLKRDGLALSINQALTEKFRVDLFTNFINSRSDNRPNLGYGYENVMYGFNWTGRNFDISSLRDYWQAGQVGIQHFDFNYLWLTNPYLTLFENTNSFVKNRVLGNLALTYDFTNKLSLRVRTGIDNSSDSRAFRRAFSTNRRVFGGYREDDVRLFEMNSDILLTYSDQFNSDWLYSVSAGANRLDQNINYSYTEANQLALPGIYTIENSRVPLRGSSQIFDKRINSVYAFGNFSYRSVLFIDLTLRNDWSSTLPAENNSFAYYSGGLSYVLSKGLPLPKSISNATVRFNVASVGNDTNPYQLNNTFQFNQNYGSFTRVTNGTVLNNPNLKPERLNSLEAGMAFGLWRDRIQTDIAVFQNTSINQIIGRPISTASGFSNIIENGGEVRTRGLEASVQALMFERGAFSWSLEANFTTYRSVVTELPEGVDQYVTGEASVFRGAGGSNSVFYIARKNGRIGDMYGSGFQEFEGQTIFGSNGLPIQDGRLRLLGNYNPDFFVGLTNQFRYKKLQLGFVFDWRQGGTIVSRTKALGSTSGVLKETLEGRETGVVGQGVMNVGTPENPQYVPNTTVVPASSFYNNFFDRGNEASALYDASYLKLRQLSLYYDLPQQWVNSIGFNYIKVGFVGSNLLLFTENPHFDPELNAMQGRNLTYGVEDMSYPSTRSFGFSIKTEF
ncbi:MAG TPA: SusC/RagA family TonB-linked outer membrane protein [Algoriphagus sp.]|uniref:SusC/RagA family TonB-linked outer membrane protein n=1 Tax=unclassified Algoriphagus TaxID=2641541 RepID=UPI000C5CC96E|nr:MULTISPECIES: SusC/RagA family TonB-linked outer membrane protein [unclassified Algoriphagus]MAL14912.1 SusC/RagA family TonB-linked outer membrane protein [Algoriphagus sp.]QYH37610.1 SusC/RagA family TonB-linked outer membrane protein [Algoriphagus sp. NBT04N3]HAS60526.1 SusC/RagA family TonB-linked outer membrane protein [Algoriphagus sp.]HCD90108.1 SusC/RagA family TonB-linked outer membrane protein [Algoriphagus sp.]HCH44905.1 SusC/RagA family TonB-linked outer membrane protein [Algori|tara:strand:- start:7193 stop:10414 length:3222 start_codon:yes stop_codon:yes gene_type:complete